MKCASALSTAASSESALREVVDRASAAMAGEQADLALVFCSHHHAESLGQIAEAVREQGLGRHVMGCTGESIVGEIREVERSPALALWTIALPGVALKPTRLTFGEEGLSGWVDHTGDNAKRSLIFLGDPFSFPADDFLKERNASSQGLRIVGGMASAGGAPGQNRLVLDGEVFDDGAVGIVVEGPVSLRTVVSQGCRPIGRPLIVTRADRNMIRELGRQPVLEVFREIYEDLSEDDQERVQNGLHLGRVINEYQERFERGDFLVRNVLGTDDAGGLAITDLIRVGQTVQFHVRDAETADEDLRRLLEHERSARPDAHVAGALLFSCNGRGTRLFPQPNHDVAVIHEVFGLVPVAGFFAMGEIGPVGGQNFIHGFTASVVLFESE